MMNTSTFRYSGLVHTKSIGIVPSVDKKGVIFVYKKAKKVVSIARESPLDAFKATIYFSQRIPNVSMCVPL